MISLKQVENDIVELEAKDTSFAVCQRLAVLYVVRDNLRAYETEKPDALHTKSSSEFLSLVNGKNTTEVWQVMDDLADALKVLHPRIYNELLDNLRAI